MTDPTDETDGPPLDLDLTITSAGADRAIIRQVGFGVTDDFTILVELQQDVNTNHIALTIGGAPADGPSELVTVVARALSGVAELLTEEHDDLVQHIERQQEAER